MAIEAMEGEEGWLTKTRRMAQADDLVVGYLSDESNTVGWG